MLCAAVAHACCVLAVQAFEPPAVPGWLRAAAPGMQSTQHRLA